MARIIAYAVVLALTIGLIGQSLYYLPLLPDKVASHFGPDGRPDGFSSKASYTWTMLAVSLGTTALVVGMSATLKYLPPKFINLPNKDYWLHPDRRVESLRYVELILLSTAATTLCLFIGISYLTYVANRDQAGLPPKLLGIVVAGFVFVTTSQVIVLMLKFSRRPAG